MRYVTTINNVQNYQKLIKFIFYFLLLHCIQEESTKIMKIFYFRFLTDLHILGCPENEFTIFKNVSLSLCV